MKSKAKRWRERLNVVANISYAPNYAIVSDPYSVQMRENTDENNSEYGHFSRSKLVKREAGHSNWTTSNVEFI